MPADGRADYPFYAGQPVPLSRLQWLVLMLGLCVPLAVPLLLPDLRSGWGAMLPSLLMPAIPLLLLRRFVGPHWRALFRPLGGGDVALAAGTAVASIAATGAVALILREHHPVDGSAVGDILLHANAAEITWLLLRTVPQILGEELIAVLPLLALLAWLSPATRPPGRAATAAAWLLSALPFALAHLPAYGGNLLQCLVVIGTARLVLTMSYLRTRNLLVPSLAHLLHDWLVFAAALLLLRSSAFGTGPQNP